MHPLSPIYCIIFHHQRRIAAGELAEAARLAHSQLGAEAAVQAQVFDAQSSRPIDIDWRGSAEEVAARLQPAAAVETAPAARGRPRLGVVSREVTLLPRHWEWLGEQPGGASVTLRKLIDQARQADEAQGQGARRRAQESVHRFMTAMAGDAPGFEEALRALFAGDRERFGQCIAEWPQDVREHTSTLAVAAFPA